MSDEVAPGRFGSIALVGRPNAGKSTLLNHLLGHKAAIVSPRPQTTRHALRGIYTDGRRQALLWDTPGFHKPLHRMNRQMVRIAEDTLRRADLVCLVVDASVPSGSGDNYMLAEATKMRATPKVVALNKVDITAKPTLLPRIAHYSEHDDIKEVVPVSAKTGDGLADLCEAFWRWLPEGEPLFEPDAAPQFHHRYQIAELIREQVLLQTRDELAYSTAVRVEFIDDQSELVRIDATILVERANQRKILIGKGGSKVREIGSAARQEIEALLGRRVHLQLDIRAEAGWREKEAVLAALEPDLNSNYID